MIKYILKVGVFLMKRLVVVLSSLLVLPAFAEVAPSTYDTDLTFSDVEFGDIDMPEVSADVVADEQSEQRVAKPKNVSTRGVAGRPATSARTTMARGSQNTTSTRGNSIRSRNISVRSTNNATPVRTTSVSSRKSSFATGSTARTGTTTRIGSSARSGSRARAASLVGAGSSLYNPNTVQTRGSTQPTVRSRGSAVVRAATNVVPTAESAIETTTELNTIKSLTEYCQSQYAACMDNYCNVLDDNQGRCTCSKNIAQYQKIENALASATEALQDVARSIQYIGLSADQISTLFAETEAELSMKNSKDNSAIRSSLDKVKRMIIDVKSGSSSSSEPANNLSFDLSGLLNFDIGDASFDFSSFLGSTTNTNTNTISNQRGESLYKTATARCKASVLNSCVAQGIDAALVTNSYDLEIDKSCLAYERALTESNSQMTQTVANAKEVLKKARLAVAQNKNSYDLRGCVSALESCMQDDYVCGSDYENCLDPTGQYIVNGAVVIGSMPGNNTEGNAGDIQTRYTNDRLFATWKHNNKSPWASDENNYQTLIDYINSTVKSGAATTPSDEMPIFLQNKIGYHNDKEKKDYGMCMSVLNKCQDYTYDSKGKYIAANEVIKQFMQRALVQIKMKQDELLTAYAEDCISDVSSCLSTNNYDASNPQGSKSRTAINSCYNQIKTCFSVNGNVFGAVQSSVLQDWVNGTYSAIETYTDNPQIDYYCGTLDQNDCTNQRGYCTRNTGNNTTTRDLMSDICTWNSTNSRCERNQNTADCNSASQSGNGSSQAQNSGTNTGSGTGTGTGSNNSSVVSPGGGNSGGTAVSGVPPTSSEPTLLQP